MKVLDIKKLFPITVEVTQEIINSAFIMNSEKCIGALTLKSILPSENKKTTFWGVSGGGIWKKGVTTQQSFDDTALLLIDSVDENGKPINMMYIKEPQTVTFKLR